MMWTPAIATLESEAEIDPVLARRRPISIICWVIGFFAAIWLFGFTGAAAIATLLYSKFAACERWPISLTLSVPGWLFFFGVFDYGLKMPFPTGAILEWLPVSVTNSLAALLG